MGERCKIQPQIFVLKGRSLRAKGVVLRQHLPICATAIGGNLHAHLLRARLPTLLHLVNKMGDPLWAIELKHNELGRIRPGAGPTGATTPTAPIDEVIERMVRILGRVAKHGVFGNVDLARALGERRALLAHHQVLANPRAVDPVHFKAPKLIRLIGSLAANPATSRKLTDLGEVNLRTSSRGRSAGRANQNSISRAGSAGGDRTGFASFSGRTAFGTYFPELRGHSQCSLFAVHSRFNVAIGVRHAIEVLE